MKNTDMRPRAAMIVAVVALVAALAGTAYAAVTITSSSQIKGRVVGGKDLQKDSVGGQAVREQSLVGVNADTLGGETLEDQKTRWLLINEQGQIEAQSGGFTIIDAYTTNQNVYVDSGEDLSDNGLLATIAIQNGVDVDGQDGDAEPNFAGEVSVARCQVTGIVACAPDGAKNVNALVVSPRNSDGTATAAGARKRVYVQVSE
jgi:ABC-type Na+ efflux pump permease subunit